MTRKGDGMEQDRSLGRRGQNEDYPVQAQQHDFLVLTSPKTLYRAVCNKTTGVFESGLERVRRGDDGHRKVINIGHGVHSQVGLALLPIKPEPASGAFSCYLLNAPFFAQGAECAPGDVQVTLRASEEVAWTVAAGKQPVQRAPGTASMAPEGASVALWKTPGQSEYWVDGTRLDFVNTWTDADWSGVASTTELFGRATSLDTEHIVLMLGSKPICVDGVGTDRPELKLLSDPSVCADLVASGAILGAIRAVPFLNLSALVPGTASRLLLALPNGKVQDLRVDSAKLSALGREFTIEELKLHPEVWRLLRNGCVIGKARLDDQDEVLVLNLSSLRGEGESKPRVAGSISGTIDFKWTPGQKLRIAFQEQIFPDGSFELAKWEVEKLLRLWQRHANLALDILDEALPPFRARDLDDESLPDYDILINLDPLAPFQVPRTRSDPERQIDFPVADIGSYALRRKYGVPTMFLGWPPAFTESASEPVFLTAKEYFTSGAFKHMALHEIGHALGLPHLHQAPAIPSPFLDFAAVSAHIRAQNHIVVNQEFYEEELNRRWESDAENRFSQWPGEVSGRAKVSSQAVQRLASDSIMMGLPVRNVLQGASPDATPIYRTEPQRIDREWIRVLYPFPAAFQRYPAARADDRQASTA